VSAVQFPPWPLKRDNNAEDVGRADLVTCFVSLCGRYRVNVRLRHGDGLKRRTRPLLPLTGETWPRFLFLSREAYDAFLEGGSRCNH